MELRSELGVLKSTPSWRTGFMERLQSGCRRRASPVRASSRWRNRQYRMVPLQERRASWRTGGKGGGTSLYLLNNAPAGTLRRLLMSFDSEHFELLLRQAREQADQALAKGDARLQHAAFLSLLDAVRQLGAASGDW